MLVLISCVFHGKGLEGDFLDDQTVEKIPRQAAYGIGEGAPVPVGGLFRVGLTCLVFEKERSAAATLCYLSY
jgi:hypothetical protein